MALIPMFWGLVLMLNVYEQRTGFVEEKMGRKGGKKKNCSGNQRLVGDSRSREALSQQERGIEDVD